MHKNWRWNLHGHISLLPFTIGYALFAFFVYGARSWGLRNGVLVAIASKPMIGNPGAQTIGGCECYANSVEEARADLHVHENGHVVQAMCFAIGGAALTPVAFAALGWSPALGLALGGFIGAACFSLAYGACFLFGWIARGFGPWHDAYRGNPFEAQCYERQAAWLAMSKDERAKVWT